jgi:hypothetical protein
MQSNTRARVVMIVVVLAGLLVISVTTLPVYAAGRWYVTSGGNDSKDCQSPVTACATLTGALNKPSFVAGDMIQVAIGTYTGTGTEVVRLDKDVTLSGGWNTSFATQSGTSIVDGQGARRGITVNGSITVEVDRFTIQHGFDTGGGGGGISNDSGQLMVRNSAIINNVSSYPDGSASGGGIFSRAGTLTVIDSTISGNVGDFGGGGIWNGVNVATITGSIITGNTAGKAGYGGGGGGGGIENFSGTLLVNNSTISNNTIVGGFSGSGIDAGGTTTLNNTTVSGNSGGSSQGGIYSFVGTVNLNNSTISGNEASGIFNQAGTFNLQNTILANNGGQDCFNDLNYNGTITSLGHNLIKTPGNCVLTGNDLSGVDPMLGPLQDNGGPSPTLALQLGSQAIDGGNPGTCLPTDQRGSLRFGPCDIGAYEYRGTSTALTTSLNPSVFGQTVTFTATVTKGEPGTPTGTVTFYNGTSVLGVSTVNSSAQATLTVDTLAAGTHNITAIYTGDTNFAGSTTTALAQQVDQASTLTSITAHTPDPAVVGQPVQVNFSVSVHAPGEGIPTGTVTVGDGVVSCSVSVAAGQCSLIFTTPGSKALTARYVGDINFAASTSVVVDQVVRYQVSLPLIRR